MSLDTYVARYIPAIDAEILRVVDGSGDIGVYNLVRYQLGWMDERATRLTAGEAQRHGGKKLRPALTLLAAEACGGDWQAALPAAAAIELIHNFSLVHDDVEDGDRLRRHRLTVWGVWGVPQAVNCGSAMQGLVYRAALGAAGRLEPAVVVDLVSLLTSAIVEMTEGQYLDIDFQEHGAITVAQSFDMTSRKTGALLEAALRCGARTAGAPRELEDGLARFGRHFGLAFQARDDYLGMWGDSSQSGKAVGADLERRKKSLPVAYALEHHPRDAGRVVQELMAQPEISHDDCLRVAARLEACGARAFTEDAAEAHRQEAIAALEGVLPTGPEQQALHDLAELAVLRHH